MRHVLGSRSTIVTRANPIVTRANPIVQKHQKQKTTIIQIQTGRSGSQKFKKINLHLAGKAKFETPRSNAIAVSCASFLSTFPSLEATSNFRTGRSQPAPDQTIYFLFLPQVLRLVRLAAHFVEATSSANGGSTTASLSFS